MKKSISIILIFLAVVQSDIYAQKQGQALIDSLQNTLLQLKENRAKADVLNSLSWQYYSKGSRDSALSYAQQALKLSEKLHFKKGQATALRYIGNHYSDIGAADKSTECYQKALDISEEIDDKQGAVYNLRNLGHRYAEHSDLSQAMEHYQQALQTAKTINDQTQICEIYKDIGNLEAKFSNYPLALENYQQALKISEKSGDKRNSANILVQISWLYRNIDDKDKTIDFLNRSLKIYLELKDKQGASTVFSHIGNFYMNLPDYEKSITYYTRSIELKKELNDESGLTSDYFNMAGLYQFIADYPTALKYLKEASDLNLKLKSPVFKLFYLLNMGLLLQNAPDSILVSIGIKPQLRYQTMVHQQKEALTLAKEIGDGNLLGQALNFLTSAYVGNKDFKSAYYSLQFNNTLRDSIQGQNVKEEIVRKEVQSAFEKKADAIKAEQEKKDIRQRNIRNTSFAALAVLLIFSIVSIRQRNKILKEKKTSEALRIQSDNLLHNILPSEVAEELKAKGNTQAKFFDEASVLFTDFVNFTQTVEHLSPQQLVEELNECFTAFDNIIESNGLEKIKTIGDAYLAVCGLPVANPQHAKKTVQAALEIRNFMAARKRKENTFDIRIGIHSGSVVAGIVGVKKFAYDIWGDTVNTAARMEQNGEAGKVNISETTYQLVKKDFECAYRGKIDAKGKGEIDMYFVN